MEPFELYYASGGRAGKLIVWAPDAEIAIATVQAHPSRFGLHEDPIVGRPTQLERHGRRYRRAA
jgi:hypothetical protein